MIQLELQPEIEAQLTAAARDRGIAIADYIHDIVSERLNEEGLRRGLEDIAAGRTRPAHEFFAEFRERHGIQG